MAFNLLEAFVEFRSQGAAQVKADAQELSARLERFAKKADKALQTSTKSMTQFTEAMDAEVLKKDPFEDIRESIKGAKGDLDNLKKSLEEAKKKGIESAAKTKAAFLQLRAAVLGVAGGIAAISGAFAVFVRRAFNTQLALANVAESLQVTGKELTAFRLAAQETGNVSAGQFDQAFGKLNATIQQAVGGNEQAIKSFSALGISVTGLKSRDAAENFKAVAEAISKVTDDTKAAALATSVFGEAGRDLVSTLRIGKDGLADYAKEAERLGLALGAQQLAQIQETQRSLERMFTVLSASGKGVAAELSPDIQELADDITELAAAANRTEKQMLSWVDIFKSIAKRGLPDTVEGVAELTWAWNRLTEALSKDAPVRVQRNIAEVRAGQQRRIVEQRREEIQWLKDWGTQTKSSIGEFTSSWGQSFQDISKGWVQVTERAKEYQRSALLKKAKGFAEVFGFKFERSNFDWLFFLEDKSKQVAQQWLSQLDAVADKWVELTKKAEGYNATLETAKRLAAQALGAVFKRTDEDKRRDRIRGKVQDRIANLKDRILDQQLDKLLGVEKRATSQQFGAAAFADALQTAALNKPELDLLDKLLKAQEVLNNLAKGEGIPVEIQNPIPAVQG